MTAWTPPESERLRELWGLNMIVREIRDTLEEWGYPARTERAIAGQAHRMKLVRRTTHLRPIRPTSEPGPRECQYPLWDTRPNGKFCGDTVARPGTPYCAKHMAACYGNPVWRA